MRVDDLLTQAVRQDFDLIILNPEDLGSVPDRRRLTITIRQAVDAIRSIKTLRRAPILCVSVSPENELLFSEAGADLVLGLPFNCEDLKSAVTRFVTVPASQPEPVVEATRPSFGSALLRSWEKLTSSLNL